MTTMSIAANASTVYLWTLVMTCFSIKKHLLVDCALAVYLSDLSRNLLARDFRHIFLRPL
jgi:hypothetical protein